MISVEFLERYCGYQDKGTGEDISKPWSRGAYTYATDSRILLRVPRIDGVEENPEAPDCAAYFEKNPFPPDGYTLWQQPDSITDAICPECTGKTYVVLDSGTNQYECGCKTCDKTGLDLSQANYRIAFRIGNHRIAAYYVQKIISLLGWRIAPFFSESGKPIPIKFDGGIGFVMGVKDIVV